MFCCKFALDLLHSMSLTLLCSLHLQEPNELKKKWLLVILYFRSYMQGWVISVSMYSRVMGASIFLCKGDLYLF